MCESDITSSKPSAVISSSCTNLWRHVLFYLYSAFSTVVSLGYYCFCNLICFLLFYFCLFTLSFPHFYCFYCYYYCCCCYLVIPIFFIIITIILFIPTLVHGEDFVLKKFQWINCWKKRCYIIHCSYWYLRSYNTARRRTEYAIIRNIHYGVLKTVSNGHVRDWKLKWTICLKCI